MGPSACEVKYICKTIYVSQVCVIVQAVLRGEVEATYKGWYV